MSSLQQHQHCTQYEGAIGPQICLEQIDAAVCPLHNILVVPTAEFRGKELVMRLMMHPEPEVQKQALLCVQKIMLAKDKLEYLNSS